jgi:hypothetical protein
LYIYLYICDTNTSSMPRKKAPVRWTCGACVARRGALEHAGGGLEARPAGNITLRATRAVHPELRGGRRGREGQKTGKTAKTAKTAKNAKNEPSPEIAAEMSSAAVLLPLQRQERVRLEFFREDGWWYGTSLATHRSGWFPSAYVDYLPGFKLDCTRCCECYAANPRFSRKLPGVCPASASAAAAAAALEAGVEAGVTKPKRLMRSPRHKTTTVNKAPAFPDADAAAMALAETTQDAILSLRPMSSPLKVQSHYGRMCNHLEILSLSPLLLRLDGFLSPEVCRKLIASAYERGFSKEESGCHGDDGDHDHHHHLDHDRDRDHALLLDEEQQSESSTASSATKTNNVIDNADNKADHAGMAGCNSATESPPSACTDTNTNSRSGAQRTSTACWLRGYDYETADSSSTEPQGLAFENRSAFFATEDKIAALSGFPNYHQEPLQVVRYFPGQQFVPHMDWIDEYTQEEYGGRVITVLIYLQACKEGGATSFPTLGKTVPPMRGTALFWYNCHPTDDVRNNVTVDERLLHAGEPVLSGEKIVAVTWVHPFSATKIRDA